MCVATALSLWAVPAASAEIHVTSSADSGAGSLREAVAAAPPAETIVIDGGVNPVLSSEIRIDKSLTIRGQGPTSTTISGGGVTRVFNIGSITPGIAVRIEALAIIKGHAPTGAPGVPEASSPPEAAGRPGGAGGAILTAANQVELLGLALSENVAGTGGNGGNAFSGSFPGEGGAGGSGGAIANSGILRIDGSTFAANHAGVGGSAGVSSSAAAFPGRGGSGGAIFNSGTLTISNSTFSNNAAGQGIGGSAGGLFDPGFGGTGGDGGALATIGSLSLSSSTFNNNNAGIGGSGAFGTLAASPGGSGGSGGAISGSGTVRVANLTAIGNSAGGGGAGGSGTSLGGSGGSGGNGGAIELASGTAVVSGATLSANSPGAAGPAGTGSPPGSPGSAGTGGAVYGAATVNGSIFAGNIGASPNCGGGVVAGATDIAYPEAGGCTGVTVADPKLDPAGLADNGGPTKTIALLPGSAAIDAVPTSACLGPDGSPLTTDQRGVSRPQGPACDSGAFEVAVPAPPSPPSQPGLAPKTVLTKKPKHVVKTRKKRARVTLAFTSDPAGGSFECKLDKGAFKPCRSSKTYKLKPGRHGIEVRAALSGLVDPTPARVRVKVIRVG